YLSKDLATIRLDVKPILELDDSVFATPDYRTQDVIALFTKEGYRQIATDLTRQKEKSEAAEKSAKKSTGKAGKKSETTSGEKSAKKSTSKKSGKDLTESAGKDGEIPAPPAGKDYILVNDEKSLKQMIQAL